MGLGWTAILGIGDGAMDVGGGIAFLGFFGGSSGFDPGPRGDRLFPLATYENDFFDNAINNSRINAWM